jgi:hypothetical protein
VATELTIRLHEPHLKQREFKLSKAKRKVIVTGRRAGKTTVFSDVAIEGMLAGRRVLEAAPTAEQTDVFWEACVNALAEPIAAGLVRKNETERLLESNWNKGRIRAKTAWNADALRGDYADLLLLDEYSIMDPSTWTVVGAPMLLDNNGDAAFAFTPKRKNHGFHLYQRAISDDSGRWAAWHFTSLDNPYLSPEALAEITSDLTDQMYRQEILAEFLEGEGAVFRNIDACMHAPLAIPREHYQHHIVAGVDWAKQTDFTAISVVCATCRREIARDRFNQIDYVFQRTRLGAMCDHWQPAIILAEANSIGEPVIEVLQREGLPVVGFTTTAVSKPPLIESLSLAFERGECQWQADPIWTGELEAYEQRIGATGRSAYSAPEGLHDDTVIARALAWWAVTMPQLPAEGTYVYDQRVEISPF